MNGMKQKSYFYNAYHEYTFSPLLLQMSNDPFFDYKYVSHPVTIQLNRPQGAIELNSYGMTHVEE